MYFETGGFPQNLCIILCAEALIWFLYASLFLWARNPITFLTMGLILVYNVLEHSDVVLPHFR